MAFQPEEDLSCPICQEVFKEPVFLSCDHSFCKDCLSSWWREKSTQECPVCKRRSSRSDLPLNLILRNLCEAYVQQREQKTPEEQVCGVHSERLKLFCLTDQQPVCVVCRDSKAHEDHHCQPMAEAAQDLRDELDKRLLPLKENLQKAKDLKKKVKGIEGHIKYQYQHIEKQIQAEFKKLHQFLVAEEESGIKALREEEEQKTQRMKDKMAAVSGEIEALSESIRATEEQLRAPDVSFLLKNKAAVERVQRCPLLEEEEPQLGPESLIDQAKHLGNLTFNIWISVHRLVRFTPVILDPNRVVNAVVSDDLTRLTAEGEETGQESDKGAALGSEGFLSGSHSWDVEVGHNEKWGLGVLTEDSEKWVLRSTKGRYAAGHNGKFIPLALESNPVRIRVRLDCDKREVSFCDADSGAHVHAFTEISQKKMFPSFFTGSKSSIKILPQKI